MSHPRTSSCSCPAESRCRCCCFHKLGRRADRLAAAWSLGLALAAQALSCAYYGIFGRLDDRPRHARARVGRGGCWSDMRLLDGDCRCRGHVDRARAAILRAVSRDPARERLRADRPGHGALVSVPSLDYLVSGAHAHRWMLRIIGNADQASLVSRAFSRWRSEVSGCVMAWRRGAARTAPRASLTIARSALLYGVARDPDASGRRSVRRGSVSVLY